MQQYVVSEFLFDYTCFDLSAKAKAVMAYLAFRSNKNHTCFPALKTIASGCSLSLSTVKRAIRELLGLQLIKKNERFRVDGGQTSNLYILNSDMLTKKDKTSKKKISPKLCNSSEDTVLKKMSVCDNDTPNSAHEASDNVIISHSSPCCLPVGSGPAANGSRHPEAAHQSDRPVRENLDKVRGDSGETSPKPFSLFFKLILLNYITKLVDSFRGRKNRFTQEVANSLPDHRTHAGHEHQYLDISDPPPRSL